MELWQAEAETSFADRLLPVTKAIFNQWAILSAQAHRRGTPIAYMGGFIAATAVEHDLTIATRNVKDFYGLGAGIFMIDPFLDVFNGPSVNESTKERSATTVPTQVFALFNSRFAHDSALAFAARIASMGGDANAKVSNLFLYALNRKPREPELRRATAFLRDAAARQAQQPLPPRKERSPLVRSITSELTGTEVRIEEDSDPVKYEENPRPEDATPETRALAELALVLFNSNEFVYVY